MVGYTISASKTIQKGKVVKSRWKKKKTKEPDMCSQSAEVAVRACKFIPDWS
jgi:hypothetical protein